MIIISENKEKKEILCYVFTDSLGEELENDYYYNEVCRYSEMGYQIHSIVYPKTENLPKEAQILYDEAYSNAGLFRLLDDVSMEVITRSVIETLINLTSQHTTEEIVAGIMQCKKNMIGD
ncbi:MAG: hypothetical protein IJC12_03115 [Peptococcaceae bacterium]|nr:hypothetical protein [Peptococcaceae bacterium]